MSALALALALMVAAFRDVEQLVGMFVGLGLFFAPIFYAVDHAPAMLKGLLWLNPYTPFANGYHEILLAGAVPVAQDWGAAFAWLGAAGLAALLLYRRGRDQVTDWM
jgi:lipopolysaccharide transport system permease protein